MPTIDRSQATSPQVFQGVAVDRPLDGEVPHRPFCLLRFERTNISDEILDIIRRQHVAELRHR